jgi:hypothetical protein
MKPSGPMRSAARKQVGMQFNIEVKFNPEVRELEVFKVWKVVAIVNDPYIEVTLEEARNRFDPEAEVDDELLEKLDPSYGRIAAQAAKQNLMQRLRDAEREIIFNEFKNRKEEIVSVSSAVRAQNHRKPRNARSCPKRSRFRASATGRRTASAPTCSTST